VRIWRPADRSELLPAISTLFLRESVDLMQLCCMTLRVYINWKRK
jgi:hypothetical protein